MRRAFESDLAVVAVITLGVMLRLLPGLNSDFPINDGGMFYVMTQQISANNFHLPEVVTYNNLQLPFAYPPLGFYVMAVFNSVLNLDLLIMFRWVPMIWAGVSVAVFFILAIELFENRVAAMLATFVYATVPAAYDILLAGGGVTRGLGLVLAMLGLRFFIKFAKKSKGLDLIAAGVFGGLGLLTHMEMAVFWGLGIVMMAVFYKVKLSKVVKMGLVATIISSPWWLTVLTRFGLGPFLAAWESNLVIGNGWQKLLLLNFTLEPKANLWAVITMMGCLFLIWQKKYFLPIWLGLIFIVLRRGPEITGVVIAALISGEFLNAGLRQTIFKRRDWLLLSLAGVWLAFNLWVVVAAANFRTDPWMEIVSYPDRQAMNWINSQSGLKGKFLVVSGTPGNMWARDGVTEWFPALTGRESITTIQGSEWLAGEPLKRYQKRQAIFECLKNNLTCIDSLYDPEAGLEFEYLYLTNQEDCFGAVCPDMGVYAYYLPKKFTQMYQKDGVSVWKRIW